MIFFYEHADRILVLIPVLLIATAITLFARYCYRAYKDRIRKKVDEQMKISLLSVVMILLPMLTLIPVIVALMLSHVQHTQLIITYGLLIFFGWITAIILGMTFKTLPFIVWNKVYHGLSGKGKTPNPKDLFSDTVFKWMALAYLSGFALFTIAINAGNAIALKAGAFLLLVSATLYTWNVIKIIAHKPQSNGGNNQ
jgi:hypothetical protein